MPPDVPGAAEPEINALAALDAGDRDAALRILMASHGSAIFRYCRQMVRDHALAEDVLQTTFLDAYRDFGRFQRRSSLRSWLFGIASHRCLDALKTRRRREARFSSVDELPSSPRGEADVEREVAETEVRERLEDCLARLDARIRAAVLLRYMDGASYPEMAAAIGDRPATLQARVARALPVLRRCLEQHGVAP